MTLHRRVFAADARFAPMLERLAHGGSDAATIALIDIAPSWARPIILRDLRAYHPRLPIAISGLLPDDTLPSRTPCFSANWTPQRDERSSRRRWIGLNATEPPPSLHAFGARARCTRRLARVFDRDSRARVLLPHRSGVRRHGIRCRSPVVGRGRPGSCPDWRTDLAASIANVARRVSRQLRARCCWVRMRRWRSAQATCSRNTARRPRP